MLNITNLKELLIILNFQQQNDSNIWRKNYDSVSYLSVDFDKQQLIYPEDQGFIVNDRTTSNFSSDENFVVFECVNRLFEKGYKPEHVELEKKWKLGHSNKSGRADILIKNHDGKPLLIIECKTSGNAFEKAWKDTLSDGAQLFSYIQQTTAVGFVCLYASTLNTDKDQIIVDQRIISHTDNQKILDENTDLKSYANAHENNDIYNVWKNTYNLEYTESGIFEDNIQAYQIGKDKYTLTDDTRPITNTDKKGKYNQFATILRKYNVSRKENAFEVLVNLFLCKIVDETQNPTDLKFYWKGIAYDNYYDFIDRLQELYKVGMEKYLEQEITYVSNQEIDGAFWAYANKKNATKNTIKDLFKKLKFYNDNNFGFIGVKNKEGFNKNAKIILEVTQMWQTLRLKTKEQNQFLGDMFEFFLDSGVKQSEGQYFTPVPICKFIVNSLPLESMVQNNLEPLRVIDYACGSGHFLTEYAGQIEHIARDKAQDPNSFYKEIYGIEKEDRLAKVAKVSAFMYGFDGVNIIDNDALVENSKIKEESFDILIANPPFAVKEFLTTIPSVERDKYELTPTVSDINTNDDIQNFFLERAKQLLNKGGIAGIVIPNTILTNTDKISVQTREILLRYFNFISIVELPPSTFGKTGTNTVVIYLERKSQRPEVEEHFKNRVDSFFDNQIENQDFEDSELIAKYCSHNQFILEEYLTLLQAKPSKELLDLEIFREYKVSFDNQTEIRNLVKSRQFSAKSDSEQELEIAKKFINYITNIEKDKLYYFILANSNPKPVLIVRCPTETKDQKKFLGYEWSGSKGSEGIRYNAGDTVHDINTIMFNPKDRNDQTKISYYIRQNFIKDGQIQELPETLNKYCSYHPLTNLLDFSRTNFDKAVSLTPKKTVQDILVKSKYPLLKIAELNILLKRGKSTKYGNSNIQVIKSGQARGYFDFDFKDKTYAIEGLTLDERKLQFGDLLINSTGVGTAGRVTLFNLTYDCVADSHITIFRPNHKINSVFALLCLASIGFKTIERMANGSSGQIELTIPTISNIKLPVPPLKIQEQIVVECEVIDQQVENAKSKIEILKNEIDTKIESISKEFPIKSISNIAELNPSKTQLKNTPDDTIVSFVEMASVSNDGFIATKIDKKLGDLKKGSYTYFADNDIIIAKVTPCMENGKCAVAKDLTNGIGMGSSEFHVIRVGEDILNSFLFSVLNRKEVRILAEQQMTGSSGLKRVPINFYASYKVPVPPLNIQNQILAEIEVLEKQITQNQFTINTSKALKQAILDKYLN